MGITPTEVENQDVVGIVCGFEFVTLPSLRLGQVDLVAAIDSRAGISAEAYRVKAIEKVYECTKHPVVGRQTLTLGGR